MVLDKPNVFAYGDFYANGIFLLVPFYSHIFGHQFCCLHDQY